jgi:hypothetical protein
MHKSRISSKFQINSHVSCSTYFDHHHLPLPTFGLCGHWCVLQTVHHSLRHQRKNLVCDDVGDYNTNSCFPPNVELKRLEAGKWVDVLMQDISIGDTVMDGEGRETKVLSWLHKDPDTLVKYFDIAGLRISPDHLVKTPDGFQKAKDAQTVFLYGKETNAVRRSFYTKGMYAPLTESGTLLVDGFSVSCYANIRWQWMGDLFTLLYYHWNPFFQSNDNQHVDPPQGSGLYTKMMDYFD